jgi:hypothetical protein
MDQGQPHMCKTKTTIPYRDKTKALVAPTHTETSRKNIPLTTRKRKAPSASTTNAATAIWTHRLRGAGRADFRLDWRAGFSSEDVEQPEQAG